MGDMPQDPGHQLSSGPFEITEEQLAEAAPKVRALQIQRYERLYGRVDERVAEDERGDRPIDPRFLELGIRILKEEYLLYRLGKAPAVVEEDDDNGTEGVDRMQMVLRQLEELEAKKQERAAKEQARQAGRQDPADRPEPPAPA